jgi:glucokinase-like ROK family protein
MSQRTARTNGAQRDSEARINPLAQSVLRLIWEERRFSRAEIAERTGSSRSTITDIVDDLLPTGLVAEVGVGPSRGGRPPIVLEFNYEAGRILGVDIGAAHVAVALTDLRGQVLAWQHRFHPVRTEPEGTRALIADLCAACLGESPGSRRLLVGIGVAVPCPVDPEHPDHFSELVLPDWRGRSGLGAMAKRFRVPLLVDNDANLGALAEHRWGAGRGIDDFAYVKVATGLGAGHIIRGEIYRGATGMAGEIGHVAIDPHGKPCMCGLRGCLATLVGAPALVERAHELLAAHPRSRLAGRPLSIEVIEDAALAGDPLALQIVREAAGHLGIAIAGLLNLMNPRLVILGGGLARVGEILLEPLREVIRSRTLVSSLAVADVKTSELGPQSIAVGAATLVLDAALEDARMFPAPVPEPRARAKAG